MRRCVIVGGAAIFDYPTIKKYLKEDDFFIYCDCGLKHRYGLMHDADLIIGDFDSHENPMLETETIVLPHKKDDTDTMYAVKEAISRGFQDFVLIGVAGNRVDHTLGNLYALLYLYNRGKRAVIIDDYSEMEIVGTDPAYISDSYPYFSLVNITGTASGITIKNAVFPLEDAAIECEYQYGVSNEVIPGTIAEVSVKNGCLLLIKDRED